MAQILKLKRKIVAVDLFCGAGGTTTGLSQVANEMGYDLELHAVNHWERAIETLTHNHPYAKPYQKGLDELKPSKVIPGRRVDLLVASPECTHHSRAKGGKPRDDQSRSSAFHVLHWCQELFVKTLLIENVPDFMSWGPLDEKGHPLKSKKGEIFNAFIASLKAMNYHVDYGVLNCANYGDATTRERFFLQATRGQKPTWPAYTHGIDPSPDLFGNKVKPWVAAKDIIDWSNLGHSIFLDAEDVQKAGLRIKRPLVENTMARVANGFEKVCDPWMEPFLVVLRGTAPNQLSSSFRRVDSPIPVVTAGGGHIALCRPFIIPQQSCGAPRPTTSPISTISTAGAISLIQPFIIATGQTGAGPGRVRSTNNPISTVVTKAEHYLCQPFLVQYYGNGMARPVDAPFDTITTTDRFGLARPIIIKVDGKTCLFDCLYRMLTPEELARAHSFPEDYYFSGNQGEIVMQIGNSVPVNTARAMCQNRLMQSLNVRAA